MSMAMSQEAHERQKRNSAAQARRQKRQAIISDYKRGMGCVECKESDPLLLDFHHLNPDQKDFTIAEKLHTVSMDRLWAEILKCEILCVSCHRRAHSRHPH
jgi:hypothetical protein